MSDLAILGRQVGYEQRSYWRNPVAAGFSFLFPLLLMVIFSSTASSSKIKELGDINYTQYYIPSIVAFGIMGVTFTNLAITVSFKRDAGTLKRVRGSPLPPWIYMGGLIGNAIVVCVLLAALVLTIGMLAYNVTYPGHTLTLIVTLAVGAASFCALGLAMTTFMPNADAAPAIVNLVFFPLLFISGTFGPVNSSSTLGTVASFFPVKHFIDATFGAFDPRVHGSGFRGGDLLIILLWGAAGLVIGARRFRWEPTTK